MLKIYKVEGNGSLVPPSPEIADDFKSQNDAIGYIKKNKMSGVFRVVKLGAKVTAQIEEVKKSTLTVEGLDKKDGGE